MPSVNAGPVRQRRRSTALFALAGLVLGAVGAALVSAHLAPLPSIGAAREPERALVWCLGKRSKAERLAYWKARTGLEPTDVPMATGAATVTFARDIAPILFRSCASCHRPGEVAPFSVLTYQDVKPWVWLIGVVTANRYMPPWPPGHDSPVRLLGERRLADHEIALIQQWIAQGAVEGDPGALPPPPRFPDGWQLGEPDLVVSPPEPYLLPTEGTDVYRNFVIPVSIDRSHWVRAVEIRPGSKRIVHHGLMQVDHLQAGRRLDLDDPEPGFGGMDLGPAENPGGHLIAWSPGKVPQPVPDGMAWRISPGDDLILQLHMLPSDRPESIDPRVGLFFTDQPARYHPFSLVLRDNDIDIEPGETHHVIEETLTLPVAVEVLAVYPHAHYVAKEISSWATFPDGRDLSLIHIKDWDFGWQDEYRYAEPVKLPAGTQLSMRFVYDNSADNPRNPTKPPQRVVAGNRSTDEMAIIVYQVLADSEGDEARLREAVMRDRLERHPESWSAHNLLGIALRGQARTAEAIREFEEAMRLNPSYPGIVYNLANALQAQGDHEAAIRYYQKVLEVEPEHPKAHNNLAGALQALGRANEAVDQYRQQVELTPHDARARFNLGLALSEIGEDEQAIGAFRRALELDPELEIAQIALADALRGSGGGDEAFRLYQIVVERDPSAADAQYGLGVMLLQRGEVDGARARFRSAVELDQALLWRVNDLAWRLATDPDALEPTEAVVAAELVAEMTRGTDPAILDTLAAAYAAQGQFELAVATLERALGMLDADHSLAGELEARLDRYRGREPFLARPSNHGSAP